MIEITKVLLNEDGEEISHKEYTLDPTQPFQAQTEVHSRQKEAFWVHNKGYRYGQVHTVSINAHGRVLAIFTEVDRGI